MTVMTKTQQAFVFLMYWNNANMEGNPMTYGEISGLPFIASMREIGEELEMPKLIEDLKNDPDNDYVWVEEGDSWNDVRENLEINVANHIINTYTERMPDYSAGDRGSVAALHQIELIQEWARDKCAPCSGDVEIIKMLIMMDLQKAINIGISQLRMG